MDTMKHTPKTDTMKPWLSAEQQASLASLFSRCQEREHIPGHDAICIDCLKAYLVNSGWGGCVGLNPAAYRACYEIVRKLVQIDLEVAEGHRPPPANLLNSFAESCHEALGLAEQQS